MTAGKPLSTTVGSILTLPLFALVYVVVGSLAYAAMMLMNWFQGIEVGAPIFYVSQLTAYCASAVVAVYAARQAFDAWIKHWNGWPVFVLVVLFVVAFVVVCFNAPERYGNWWQITLYAAHNVFLLGAAAVNFITNNPDRPE